MTTDPRAKFEEMSLNFIAEEIEIGLTFATVAATEHAQGRIQRAHEVWAKAERACAEAEHRLVEAQQRGCDVAGLSERLHELRERLQDQDSEGEARKTA